MPKASDLKRGQVVEINNAPYVVKKIDVRSPSSRGANTLYKVRFNALQSGQKLEETYKGEDMLKDVDLLKRQVQYSYNEGDIYTFMDVEDYTQYSLNRDEMEDELPYLTDGLEGLLALIIDDKVLGIELPQAVNLTIEDTTPALKGATATARTKPARLVSGLEIQVPEYIENGEVIKVNTTTGKFMSRA